MKKSFLTPRMEIRPYQKSDADAVWPVLRHPLIFATTAFIPRDYPRSRVEWWIAFIESAARNRTGYEFGMFDRKTGRYIGNVGIINVHRGNQSGSITYFIDPEFWNLGYASEGAEEMLRFAFEDLGLHRVGGTCMSCNPASRRVMEKLGFTFVGTVRDELCKEGTFIDIDHLSLLSEEWKNKKGRI